MVRKKEGLKMLTPGAFVNAIKAELETAAGEVPVHTQPVNTGFARPCFAVEYKGIEKSAQAAGDTVELRMTFLVSAILEKDAYSNADFMALYAMEAVILGVFLPGYLKVGGRAPKVADLKTSHGGDYTTVSVVFSYMVNVEEFRQEAAQALAEAVQVRTVIQ